MKANVLKDIHAYIRVMCHEPVYKNDRIIDGMMVKHLFQFLLCLAFNIYLTTSKPFALHGQMHYTVFMYDSQSLCMLHSMAAVPYTTCT